MIVVIRLYPLERADRRQGRSSWDVDVLVLSSTRENVFNALTFFLADEDKFVGSVLDPLFFFGQFEVAHNPILCGCDSVFDLGMQS